MVVIFSAWLVVVNSSVTNESRDKLLEIQANRFTKEDGIRLELLVEKTRQEVISNRARLELIQERLESALKSPPKKTQPGSGG